MDDILNLPSPDSDEYEEDDGDDDHMENFISFSDNEETVNQKQKQAHSNFQKRVQKRRKQRDKKPY